MIILPDVHYTLHMITRMNILGTCSCNHITMYMYCKCTHGNMITTMNILKTHSCDHIKYDHNPVAISSEAFYNGQIVAEYHWGIPTRVSHDGLPRWYSTTGTSQIITPAPRIQYLWFTIHARTQMHSGTIRSWHFRVRAIRPMWSDYLHANHGIATSLL